MKKLSRLSRSNQENGDSLAHTWLQEKVYAPKRERTIKLVRTSVDTLLEEGQQVSLSSVATKSSSIDPEGKGISESAILNNEEARAYYQLHRTWCGVRRKQLMNTESLLEPVKRQVKLDRDIARARQRYLRMSKVELVDRIITLEQDYAERQERWLLEQDEVLTWRLRAEHAEARLKNDTSTKSL